MAEINVVMDEMKRMRNGSVTYACFIGVISCGRKEKESLLACRCLLR